MRKLYLTPTHVSSNPTAQKQFLMGRFLNNFRFPGKPLLSILTFLFLFTSQQLVFGQIQWAGAAGCVTGGGTAWLTAASWCGGAIPGTTAHTQFTTLGSSTTIGINMNGATNNGANNQAVGAIEIALGGNARTVNNSSGTVAGTLTLNGATVNSVANVILRNNSSNLLTITNGGTQTMGLALGNATDNIINVDGTGGITIGSIISGGSRNLTKAGAGSGVLTLTNAANSYSGATTITTGELRLNPSANATFSSSMVLNGGTLSTTGIAATRTWTSSATLRLDANSTIALGNVDHTIEFANSSAETWAGTTLTITGWNGVGGASGTQGKIRVGAGGLTAGQLAKISFTGFPGTPVIVAGEVVPPGAGAASITPTPSSLTGLDYVFGSGPSGKQFIRLSASNLTAGGGTITIDATASPNYEVSNSTFGNGAYGATTTRAYTGTGTFANDTVWVRLKSGLSVASYNLQSIGISGGSASASFTASGSVTPIPYMVLSALYTAVTENMDVMGVAPATNTITTLPVGFRIGTDWATGSTANTVAGGTTGAGTISAGGAYNFANGINASATDRGLGFLFSGTFNTDRYIVLRFRNNTGSTVRQLDVSFDYEKYRNGQITLTNTFTHGNTSSPSTAEPAGTQVYTSDGNNNLVNPATTINKTFSLYGLSIPDGTDYYFKWTFAGSASTNAIAVGIDNFSVTPWDQSLISSATTLSGFNYTGAGPSAEQNFNLSGDNLGGVVTLTPPTNYEISLTSGGGFVAAPSTLTLTPVGGIIPSQPRNIYVRLKGGLPGGLYNGENITMTTGPISKTVTLNGGVLPEVNLSANFSSGTEIGTTVVTLTATASSPVSGNQTLTVGISGTGITAGDYTLAGANLSGNTLTILNGTSTSTFTFTIVNDIINEGLETALVTISAPSAGIILGPTVSQSIDIVDDDDAIYLNTLNVAEPTITFDDLANTGTGNVMVSKGTYVARVNSSNVLISTGYNAGDGSSNTGANYSFGVTATSERALGSLGSAGNTAFSGFKVQNNTGGLINAVEISYKGEQWRVGGTFPNYMYFEFSTTAPNIYTGSYNSIAALHFVSPQNTNANAAINGNTAGNFTNIPATTVGLGNIANGGTFWIRWKDLDETGNDHGLSIDDVVIKPLFITPSIFYSKSTGDLNDLSTWGDNTDGSGNQPANFTAAGQIFNVVNQATATLGANWSVSGATSKVIVGDGVTATTLTIPSGFSFTTSGGALVDVSAQGTLVLNHPSTPAFGTINANSTITFGATSGTQNVDAVTYGNLNFVGAGVKDITGPTNVSGNMILDGAVLDKTSAGIVAISYSGNITILSANTYNAGFTAKVNFVTAGNGNQVITGNGNALSCSQFNSLTKTSGSLSLSNVGGSTTINTQDDIRMVLSGTALFSDNGNQINVGGDFETAGSVSNYNLTGTLRMDGFPAGQVNIRQDVGGAAGAAEINHLIINLATSDGFNFQPTAAGSGTTTIKGDLTIQGSSSYSNKIRFGGTGSPTGVRLHGNYVNTLNADVIYGISGTLEFNGSVPQTFSTAYASGDNFFTVRINNAAGVTMTSGDININGAGSLTCVSGVLNTGANKVVLSNTATITETASTYVLGFVRTTRNIGLGANQSFGGIGLEVTALGASNSTLVERETGASIVMGCPSKSIRRNFTVTPTTNTGLNATVVFRYLNSVAELNGIDENFLNLFTNTGTLISNLANLNIAARTITVFGQNSLSSFTASIPGPTLSGVTITQPYICAGSTATVNLSGMLANGTFNINYSINGVNQPAIIGLTSDNAGDGSFTSPALTNAQNGTLLAITSITQTPISCSQPQSNSVVLDVRPRPTVSISANDFVCVDQTAPINFFLTGTGPWDMQYTINGGAPIVNNGIATSPQNYPYVLANLDRTYLVTSLSDANCVANPGDLTSHFIGVPNPCAVTWGGASSPDWTDGANWLPNNSAPSQFTSVIIPKVNAPNFQPVVNGAAVCADMNLNNVPTINIASGNQLNIRGDVDGGLLGGTIIGQGKVVFSGTGLQNITRRVTMSNVEFANTSAQGVNINPNSSLEIRPSSATGSGLVTFLNNSRLTNNGKFILGSNTMATAKIGPMPASFTLNGNVTIERYLPYTGGVGSWNFIGSPFTGANFTDWSDNFKVVGLTSGYGPQGGGIINGTALEPERATIFKYDEPSHDTRLDTVQKQGWRIPGNENIIPGTGYRVWVDHYSNGTHKFDNTGALVFGDFNFPTLNRSELAGCIPASFPCDEPSLRGWNLLSNPYPCDIDWDAAGGWTKPGQMSNAWYRWHASANGYGVYAGGLYAGTSPEPNNPNLIPSNQAFFVRLSAAGSYTSTLEVKESAKSTSAAGQFVRTSVADEKVKISLNKVGVLNGYSTIVRFKTEATDGFDLAYDFASLGGSSFHISVPVENTAMSISAFAPIIGTKTIPLTTSMAGQTGNFNLKFSMMESLLENNNVFLRDNLDGLLVPITEGSVYSFTVTPFDALMSNRFELVFNPSSTTSTIATTGKNAGLNVFPNPGNVGMAFNVVINGLEGSAASLTISDMLGRTVYSKSLVLSGKTIQTQISDFLPAGVYTIKAAAKNQTITQKLVVK